MNECRSCTVGKLIKGTDSVRCRLKEKVLIFNRANDCKDYKDNGELRRYKERQAKLNKENN